MSNVLIKLKTGEVRRFDHRGRAGGSWTVSVTCKDGFVTVEDEYGTRTTFPAADVAEVVETPTRGCW